MKKIVLVLLIFILVLDGCQKAKEAKIETKTLSELQIAACNTADEAGTCDTRLAEVGIVLKEDCCQTLGKCC